MIDQLLPGLAHMTAAQQIAAVAIGIGVPLAVILIAGMMLWDKLFPCKDADAETFIGPPR